MKLKTEDNKLIISCNLKDIKIIPSIPDQSESISQVQMNLWELHEINEDQIILIEIPLCQTK